MAQDPIEAARAAAAVAAARAAAAAALAAAQNAQQTTIAILGSGAENLRDPLIIDAFIRQQHGRSNQIAQHPVERGAPISDHIKHDPETLTIEGFVTDTPIGGERVAQIDQQTGTVAGDFGDRVGISSETFKRLCDLCAGDKLITVITEWWLYTDMGIEKFDAPKDIETGRALRFTLSLRKVRVVGSRVSRTVSANTVKRGRVPVRQLKSSILEAVDAANTAAAVAASQKASMAGVAKAAHAAKMKDEQDLFNQALTPWGKSL